MPEADVLHRRSRRPSLGNREFLAKALELFCERGFDGTSIDAITAAAGIAKRTVYARYGDKETLFKRAIEHAIDEWNVPIERLRAAETDDMEETLLAVANTLIENILTPAGLRLLRLTNSESARMPWIGDHNVRYGEGPVIAYLSDLFERKLPAIGNTEFTQDAAEVFLQLVVGGPANAAAWGVVSDRSSTERRARLSVKIYLHGLTDRGSLGSPVSVLEAAEKDLDCLVNLLSAASLCADQARDRLRHAKKSSPDN